MCSSWVFDPSDVIAAFGITGLQDVERREFQAALEERSIAHDRAESDACQKGTPGCCIDHTATGEDPDGTCETW